MYQCILIDPPWLERGGGKIKRGADRHYALLKTRDMPQVIYQSGDVGASGKLPSLDVEYE